MAELSKTEQDAESKARQEAKIDSATEKTAADVLDDGERGSEAIDTRQEAKTDKPAAEQKPSPTAKSVKDKTRDDIVSRFKADRITEKEEAADDITEFARSGMPPEFDETNTPVVEQAETEQETAAEQVEASTQPQKIKVKVRGKEMELTQDELIANAQKALAGESYLEEGKTKLKEIEDHLAKLRNPAARVGQDDIHPAVQNQTQTTEQTADTKDQHPDPMDKLIETIQFGDPAEAKTQLRDTIAATSKQVVTTELENQRFQDEGARTNKVLQDFRDKHADLAADSKAVAVIETTVLELQKEDLRAIGFDPDKIQTPSGVVTAGDIATAHRYYRSKGARLRSPTEMLETARDEYLKWKGIDKTDATVETTDKAKPRVEVTVDRTARRTAVPQQPSRTVSPKVNQQQPAAARDRSSIVQQEIARRNSPRGKVAV
jgi:hypothetical protein